IRDADGGRRRNCRMLVKYFIDLARVDVFTAADDHVGLPVNDVEKSIAVAIADISRMKPAASQGAIGGLRILEITFENVLTAQNDFAQLAVRKLLIIIVDNFHFVADGQA